MLFNYFELIPLKFINYNVTELFIPNFYSCKNFFIDFNVGLFGSVIAYITNTN